MAPPARWRKRLNASPVTLKQHPRCLFSAFVYDISTMLEPTLLSAVTIRPYTAADRGAVRTIACDTADRGEPVNRLFRDREVVADLITRYYTDYEPQTAWVATHDHGVIGYLTGCLESHRYVQLMRRRIIPSAVWKAVCHGALGAPQTWRLLTAAMHTWRGGGFRREISLATYPAHLHLNVHQAFRGRGIGRALVTRFLDRVREGRLSGVHVAVRADNDPSRRLFTQFGFVEISRQRIVLPEGPAYHPHDTILYGKCL